MVGDTEGMLEGDAVTDDIDVFEDTGDAGGVGVGEKGIVGVVEVVVDPVKVRVGREVGELVGVVNGAGAYRQSFVEPVHKKEVALLVSMLTVSHLLP